jgi:hypothetical protein
MPDLINVDFGQAIWETKSREFEIEKLFEILVRSEEQSNGTDSESD